MKIRLVAETISDGDGMGNHIIEMYNLLSSAGYSVAAYAVNKDTSRIPIQKFTPNIKVKKDDIMILHYGLGFDTFIESFDCRKIMEYHNITPPEFFYGYDEISANKCQRGYDDLKRWGRERVFEKVICVSEYNRQDLISIGFKEQDVLVGQLMIPFMKKDSLIDEKYAETLSKDGTKVLFVGRIAPNKKQEDIIRAFAYYQREYDKNAKLFLIGGGYNSDYGKTLQSYIDEIKVENVVIGKRLSDEELSTVYKYADVFVCMSEHEGFCIPLVEAMSVDIPVIAYSCTNIMNTMNGAGILLNNKNPRLVARWIKEVVDNKEFRNEVIIGQRRVAQNNRIENAREKNLELLKNIIDKVDNNKIELNPRLDGRMYDLVASNYRNKGKMQFDKNSYIEEIKYKD